MHQILPTLAATKSTFHPVKLYPPASHVHHFPHPLTSTNSCCCYVPSTPGSPASPMSTSFACLPFSTFTHFPHSCSCIVYFPPGLPASTYFRPLLLLLCPLFTCFTFPQFSTSTHSCCRYDHFSLISTHSCYCSVHISPGPLNSHAHNFPHLPTSTHSCCFYVPFTPDSPASPISTSLIGPQFSTFTHSFCSYTHFSPAPQASHVHHLPHSPTPAAAMPTFHPVQGFPCPPVSTSTKFYPLLLLLCPLFIIFTSFTCPPFTTSTHLHPLLLLLRPLFTSFTWPPFLTSIHIYPFLLQVCPLFIHFSCCYVYFSAGLPKLTSVTNPPTSINS